jgi:hypothetical protein
MGAHKCGDGRASVMRRDHRIFDALGEAARKLTALHSKFQSSRIAALFGAIDPAALAALFWEAR